MIFLEFFMFQYLFIYLFVKFEAYALPQVSKNAFIMP